MAPKKILRGLILIILVFSLNLMPGTPVAAATAPAVYSQSPTRGATGVAVSIQPCVNFSRAMDATTINTTNIKLMNGSSEITVSITPSGTRKAIITPSVPLNYSTSYYILVSTGVKDTFGNAMANSYGSAGGSGFTTTGPRAPTVSSQNPAKTAINVSLDVEPYVIFSKAMDFTTINSTNIQLMSNGAPIAASVALSGTNKAIITPINPLSGNTIYYIVVTTAVKDSTGIALAVTYGSATASRFTTAAAVAPTISSQYPADNATLIPFKIQPYIVFSKAMDSETINDTNIQLMDGVTPVDITISLYNFTRAIITPADPLDFSTVYTITVGTGVKDAFGNALAAPVTTSFTTDSAVPPAISSIYPADGAAGIVTDVQPCIIFSEVIDSSTLTSTNIKLMQGTSNISSTVALYGSKMVIISPQSPLAQNTAYSIVVTTGIKDNSGNALATTSTTGFTTGDVVLPVVSSQYPANGANGVAVDIQPCVIFSKEMDSSTINSTNILFKNGTTTVRANVALYGKYTAVISPMVPLSNGTTYHIVVNTGVKDLDGYAIASSYGSATSSRFVTITNTLTIQSQYPLDNAVGVPVNFRPCVVFSQPLDATTVNDTNIQLLDGVTPVAITVALFDDNSAIITPVTPLDLNTVYSIVVETGVEDTDGNALSAQVSTDFTTTTANTSPAVSYQYPAANATDVPIDVQICLIFSEEMDDSTITSANIQVLDGVTPVAITMAMYGKNTVIITLAGPLTINTEYSIVIGTGVKDTEGNTMTLTTTNFTTVNP
jgi:hypothetical protein